MYTKDFTGVFTAPATTTVFNKKKTPYKITPVQDSYKMPTEMQGIYNSAKAKATYNATTNKPNPVAPTYTPQPQQQNNQQSDYYGAYTDAINKQTQNAQSRYQTQEQMAKNETDLYNRQMERIYGQTAKTLKDQIPVLQERSQTTQDLIRKGLENVNQQGTIAKENIEEQTGTTLRSQAQSKREVDSKRNAIFAGNNTTDSYGFGGYQMEQSNADNEFLREQNMTKRERDQQLAGIDSQLVSAQTTAEMAINDEVAKFNDAVRQINSSLTMGEIEKKNAIENSYNNLEKTLFSIRDGYNTETASLYEKQLQLMQTVAESGVTGNQVGDDKLSQEFIMSGFKNPVTAYDYLYMQKNNGADQNKGQVVEAIKRLAASEGIGGMTGLIKTDMIAGTKGAQAVNDWNNLKSMLSLESRTKLKGSGAISDFEAKVLERASTLGLDQNLSETQFRERLNILLNEINGQVGSGDDTDALVAKYWGN